MKIYTAPYFLESNARLNAKASQLQALQSQIKGILLKLEFEDGVGYSSLQTWTSLGDVDLELLIEDLKKSPKTTIEEAWAYYQTLPFAHRSFLSKSFEYAVLDYEARKSKVHLLDWFAPVQNNFLISDLSQEIQIPKGINLLKIKVSQNYRQEISVLEGLAAQNYKMRLDFNACLNLESYKIFLNLISDQLKKSIEYIEEPFPFSKEWAQVSLQIPLAIDHEISKIVTPEELVDLVQVIILKPAKQDIADYVVSYEHLPVKFVITNYMDHPVGTLFASYEACRWHHKMPDKFLPSGCWTQNILKSTPEFILNYKDGYLFFPVGIGVGFDQELAHQEWSLMS